MSDHYLQIGVLFGIVITIILQTWIQPKWFREDNKRQADLLTGRFDSQLEALKMLSENAAKTLDQASMFFKNTVDRFDEIDKRLMIMDVKWDTAHKLIETVVELKERISNIESICSVTHERSMRTFHLKDSNKKDYDF